MDLFNDLPRQAANGLILFGFVAEELHRTWKACFRKTPEELLAEAIGEAEGRASDAPEPPPEEIRRHMEDFLLPMLQDRNRPADERRHAVRALGCGGYLHGFDAVLNVALDAHDPVRTDALRALENLGGELRGEDARAWTAFRPNAGP